MRQSPPLLRREKKHAGNAGPGVGNGLDGKGEHVPGQFLPHGVEGLADGGWSLIDARKYFNELLDAAGVIDWGIVVVAT